MIKLLITKALLIQTLIVACCFPLSATARQSPHPPLPDEELKTTVPALLNDAYLYYKTHFITPEGRVLRPQNNNDTVSEGQAYAMLLAVWMDDQKTFDLCYQWTEKNLSRATSPKQDDLLAWHWQDGKVLDWTAATDADTDYACALILAHRTWGKASDPSLSPYLHKAKLVLFAVLQKETVRLGDGKLYLLPGDWQSDGKLYTLNPSYFSPAWYRLFFAETLDYRWNELIDSGYTTLTELSKSFGGMGSVGLIPDWCAVTPEGILTLPDGWSTDYSWDAIRTGWRLYTDFFWFKDHRAQELLKTMANFYQKEWDSHQKILAVYSFTGQPLVEYENAATYLPCLSAALASMKPMLVRNAWDKIKGSSVRGTAGTYFINPDDYYGNSLCLFASILLTPRFRS